MSAKNDYNSDIEENAAGIGRTVTLRLAAAVVVEGDRVLVVRRSKFERFHPSVWGVPCGKVDPGESAPEAALRELQEETGLAGDVMCYLGQSMFSSVWRGQTAQNIQSNFLVHPLGTQREIRLPKEDQAAAWLSRDEIDNFHGLDIYNREVIEQWLRRVEFDQPEPASSAMIPSSRRR
jgi:8-oxo-dGTP diphosphatase